MKKSLKLESIKIQSFVTALEKNDLKDPKGGYVTALCTEYPCTSDNTCITPSCPKTLPKTFCTYTPCPATFNPDCY